MRFILSIVILFYGLTLFGQEAVPCRPSPLAIAKFQNSDTYIKITYSRPHKNGRKVFGELVPYNKLWRFGANEATEITITSDVLIDQDTLHEGTYSMFAIPNEEEWTIIFNEKLGQWGSYNYLKDFDVLRIDVPVKQTPNDMLWEPFTIDLKNMAHETTIVVKWEYVMVEIPINFIQH